MVTFELFVRPALRKMTGAILPRALMRCYRMRRGVRTLLRGVLRQDDGQKTTG